MKSILQVVEHSSWPELIVDLKKNYNKSKIYRGHANNYSFQNGNRDDKKVTGVSIDHWKLISSFNRYYSDRICSFRKFMKEQFSDEVFRKIYGRYFFNEIFYLKDCSPLERLYYLQHYGVPTCFIDFTKDPLIALYFAISTIKAQVAYPALCIDYEFYHPQEPFLSIYEINYQKILSLMDIKTLDNKFPEHIYDDDTYGFHIALDLEPYNNCHPNSKNVNLKMQQSCFILFDNENTTITLKDYIQDKIKDSGKSTVTLIKEYRLPYVKIFHKASLGKFDNVTLFAYLDKNNISGRTLFDDIQGLKYDLNFLHEM